jgi:hypothetical protein
MQLVPGDAVVEITKTTLAPTRAAVSTSGGRPEGVIADDGDRRPVSIASFAPSAYGTPVPQPVVPEFNRARGLYASTARDAHRHSASTLTLTSRGINHDFAGGGSG